MYLVVLLRFHKEPIIPASEPYFRTTTNNQQQKIMKRTCKPTVRVVFDL
jgi:hypothetical protein